MDRQLPLDPYTLTEVDEPWRNRSAGVKGHAVKHEAFTRSMEEIVNVIEQAGLVPDNEDLTQLWQALQRAATAVSFGPTSTAVISTPGVFNWIVPAGVYSILVEAWGGGGGGGFSPLGGAAAGGGSAAYARKRYAVSPGDAISGVVGAGGLGGSSSPARDGQNGTDTTVTVAGQTMSAGAGQGSPNAEAADDVRSSSGGGSYSGADFGMNGSFGFLGCYSPASMLGGYGAGAPNGGGSAAGGRGSVADGTIPGGGGGSTSNSAYSGGNGGRGQVAITYFVVES